MNTLYPIENPNKSDTHNVSISFTNGSTLDLTLDEKSYSNLTTVMSRLDTPRCIYVKSGGFKYTLNPQNICKIVERIYE